MAHHPVITVQERPATAQGRAQQWLRGRRVMVAALLAAAEVIAYLVVNPPSLLGVALVGAVLVASFVFAGRLPHGLARDLVMVVALAQAMVIALPILAGAIKLALAAIIVFAVIALFVAIGLRFRR